MIYDFIKNESHGLSLYVKVIAGSSRNQISGAYGGFLKIKIECPPEKGKANKKLISYLSKLLHIPQKNVMLISGESQPKKKILLKGMAYSQAKEIFDRLLA